MTAAPRTSRPKPEIQQTLPQSESQHQEEQQAPYGNGHPRSRNRARRCKAAEDAQRKPADHVVGHAGGHGDLTEVASHQPHIGKNLGHHRQGRDAQSQGYEHHEGAACRSFPQKHFRQQNPQQAAACCGQQHAPQGHQHRGAAQLGNESQVGLKARYHQQQCNAHEAHHHQRCVLKVGFGSKPGVAIRPDTPEHRRPQNHPGAEFSDDPRESDLKHHPAQCAGAHHQRQELHPEDQLVKSAVRYFHNKLPPAAFLGGKIHH